MDEIRKMIIKKEEMNVSFNSFFKLYFERYFYLEKKNILNILAQINKTLSLKIKYFAFHSGGMQNLY